MESTSSSPTSSASTPFASPLPPAIAPPPPSLPDPWEPAPPIPLDGVLERNAFPPWLTALLGLAAAFVLFQIVISPIATVLLLLAEGVAPSEVITSMLTIVEEHAGALLSANTIGQFLGLALPAYLFARLHSSRPAAFLRLRRTQWMHIVFGLLGLFALIPVVQWLGAASDALPWPESIRAFEQMQLELIEKVLGQHIGLLPTLLMLAVTPALCEELLFRGYVQRQAERSMGLVWGIVFSGVVFGLYHLRLTQAIPLSALGLYLAYLTWRTGSLWPAIVAHFANNAFAVFLGAYVSARPDLDVADLENMSIPWYILALGLAFFALIAYAIEQTAQAELARRRSAPPVSSG